jgi:hypothetical protein
VRLGEASGIRFEEYFFILSLLGSRDHGQMTKFLYARPPPVELSASFIVNTQPNAMIRLAPAG